MNTITPSPPTAVRHLVFRMGHSSRMAGSVPEWVYATGNASTAPEAADSPQKLAALSPAAGESPGQQAQENGRPFGFGDVLDIINPLQHIPVVSALYRAVTGDSIRPSSEIIGGALYGGVAGAAGGLADAIVRNETGKDMGQYALALVTGNSTKPAPAGAPAQKPVEIAWNEPRQNKPQNNPAQHYAAIAPAAGHATPIAAPKDEREIARTLPGTMLRFVNLAGAASGATKPIPAKPERYAALYHFNA